MIKPFSFAKTQIRWVIAFILISAVVGTGIFALLLPQLPAFAQDESNLPEISPLLVASGLERPVGIAHAADGSGRLFIVEQQGQILVLEAQRVETPFLDIRDRVASPASSGGNEQGLLGLAFPPDYAKKGYFYVYYTMRTGDNVLSRFFTTENPNLADPNSEEQVLTLPHPQYQNHNGGQLAFGPDGYLYIGVGDGGSGGDPFGNAQNPASLNGKLLRIDVEMETSIYKPSSGLNTIIWDFNCLNGAGINYPTAYLIPASNPFLDDPGYRPEIWALGLRNPWRFSFDRENGDLYIADVGQDRWEEINYQPAGSPGGQNYGWNTLEGKECYGSVFCDPNGLTLPVHVYPNSSSPNCSITGGYVYRGDEIPALEGVYFFGDFCSGSIWGLQTDGDTWEQVLLTSTSFMISAFGEDEQGEIYIADMVGGGIYQLVLK